MRPINEGGARTVKKDETLFVWLKPKKALAHSDLNPTKVFFNSLTTMTEAQIRLDQLEEPRRNIGIMAHIECRLKRRLQSGFYSTPVLPTRLVSA